jgi:hypothetical protein
MTFEGDPDDEDAVVQEQADEVRDLIQRRVAELRDERRSVFF